MHVGTWLRMHLSLTGRAEVYVVYIFLFILYHLSVLPLSESHRVALTQSLTKLLWKGRSSMARRQVCYQRPRNGGLRMPDLESHWLADRLVYQDRSLSRETVWNQKMSVIFPRLMSYPEVEGRSRPKNETLIASAARPFVNFLGPVKSLSLQRNCIRS